MSDRRRFRPSFIWQYRNMDRLFSDSTAINSLVSSYDARIAYVRGVEY